ncbi:MAG: SMC family ATPase [Treponema sp.]|nr:SMC family ATPase [Treponema sp.]
MRPIKLLMTGFESYKEKTEIDFEKLGTKGLYLITGDTGAGKTTIFDAVTFVLYGSPSGSDRSVEMLRSHFADINTPTEVELDFEANGKRYHVRRNPEYERKALRGEGTTKATANALLEFRSENREPVSGVSRVTAEIERILNLKKDQFCRIAMIAQGSFQKLLLSKKEEKQQIFRELFHTEHYQKLQDTLKADRSQAENDVRTLTLRLREALNRIEVQEQDEKADEINRIRALSFIEDDDLRTLQAFVAEDEKLLAEVIEQTGRVEAQLERINSGLQTGERRKKIQDDIARAEQHIAEKKREFASQNEVLAQAKEAAEKLPELEKQRTLLEASLKAYEEVAAEEKTLRSLASRIEAGERKLDFLHQGKTERTAFLEKLKDEAASLKNAGEKIGTLEAALGKISDEQAALTDIADRLSALSGEKDALSLAQARAQKATADSCAASSAYTEKLRLFNLEQAGILAEGLQDGAACPVCGSTEHPHPAVKSARAPSQAEIERAKQDAEALQKKATDLSVQAGQKKAAVESAEGHINGLLEKLFESLTVRDDRLSSRMEERNARLRTEAAETNAMLRKEKSAKARREEIEGMIPGIEKQLADAQAEVSQLQIEISGTKATLQEAARTLEEKRNGLQCRTLAEARQRLVQLAAQIERLRGNVEAAERKLADCKNEISVFTGNAGTLKTQLAETEAVDVEKLASEKAAYTERKTALNEQRDSLNRRRGLNLECVQSVERLIPEIAVATERFDMVNALHDVATGSNRGKSGKPSLEVYVQMEYLDRINRRANLRLRTMTDNKYELRRRIEEDGAERGLDLDVKDFYTGRRRNVQTLSGGEQFQASLALALGLADEIQESAGGIRLDTMFIDEGFGTLDPDTLNKAMRSLEDLSQGDKLIGIISHVEELESRIPKKIVVRKNGAGISSARIVQD